MRSFPGSPARSRKELSNREKVTTSPPKAEHISKSIRPADSDAVRSELPPSPVTSSPTRNSHGRIIGTLVIGSLLSSLYLLFVVHYSINALFWDEWNLVPMIHATLHSNLTFSMLWAQHNENRMLVPNLLIAGSALVHNYNSKVTILIGAGFFVSSYVLFLGALRAYLGRSITALHAFVFGILWFSLEDTENSLWGFQLAWYMIVFFLLVVAFALAQQRRHQNVVFAVAALAAIAASFSSLQGLILWPIGLIYLIWDRPRTRRSYSEIGIWLLLSCLTAALYFRDFNFKATGGGGSPSFALHHPVGMLKFFLAALGNVIPTTNVDLRMHEIVGLVLSVAAVFVVVSSFRERRFRNRRPLPLTLIAFGVLFDGSIALGRLGFGIPDALSTRYTMVNLLVIIGIGAFAWDHIRAVRTTRGHVRRISTARRVSFALLAACVILQFATGTTFGIISARSIRANRIIDARIVVNLDKIPSADQQQMVASYVYPTVAALSPFLHDVRIDHLSVFAPGPYKFYRSKGPPLPLQ